MHIHVIYLVVHKKHKLGYFGSTYTIAAYKYMYVCICMYIRLACNLDNL